MGTPQSEDKLLLTEKDELYCVGIGKTKSGRFLCVECGSSETTEWHTIDLEAGSDAPLTVFQPKVFGLRCVLCTAAATALLLITPGARYDLDHHGDNFLILTNKDGATEMKFMYCKVGKTTVENWVELIPHSEERQLCEIEVFKNFVAVEGREGGLTQLWVMGIDGSGVPAADSMRRLSFKDDLYEVAGNINRVWDTARLRITYSSLASPLTWYELHMGDFLAGPAEASPTFTVIKQKEVLNFNPDLYRTQQLFATGNEAPFLAVPLLVVSRVPCSQHLTVSRSQSRW